MSESQSDWKNLWERHNFADWRSSSLYLRCVGFGRAHYQYKHCKPKSGYKVKQEFEKLRTSIKTSTFLRKQLPFCWFYAGWQHKRCICISVCEENQQWKTKGWKPLKVITVCPEIVMEGGIRTPHCGGQYMISHSSVGEQTINTGVHKNNTAQLWGGWRLTTV